MEQLIKLWNFFNGKKSKIAAFWTGTMSLIILVLYPDGLTGLPLKIYLIISILLGATSTGHNVFKKYIGAK